MNYPFSLAVEPQPHPVVIRITSEVSKRQNMFDEINVWLGENLTHKYHIDRAEFLRIVFSFSDERDAIGFMLRFG